MRVRTSGFLDPRCRVPWGLRHFAGSPLRGSRRSTVHHAAEIATRCGSREISPTRKHFFRRSGQSQVATRSFRRSEPANAPERGTSTGIRARSRGNETKHRLARRGLKTLMLRICAARRLCVDSTTCRSRNAHRRRTRRRREAFASRERRRFLENYWKDTPRRVRDYEYGLERITVRTTPRPGRARRGSPRSKDVGAASNAARFVFGVPGRFVSRTETRDTRTRGTPT